MLLFVGLGNPDPKHKNNRHNIGFMLIDALNKKFGEVEKTGILISISDIFEKKKERHINSYISQKNGDQ